MTIQEIIGRGFWVETSSDTAVTVGYVYNASTSETLMALDAAAKALRTYGYRVRRKGNGSLSTLRVR